MNTFPKLKCGAVMQYPAEKRIEWSTRVLRFVDGKEQRFREFERPLRRWVIRLDLLDSSEWSAIDEFFVSMQGRAGTFSFEDPWNGTTYPNCSLDEDSIRLSLLGEDRGRTTLIVREDLA